MRISIELTPAREGWDITISRPDGEWSCKDISGRRAVQAVTAEIEAAIDRAIRMDPQNCEQGPPTQGFITYGRPQQQVRHIDGNPRNNEPSNLRIETRPKSHGVGPKEAR